MDRRLKSKQQGVILVMSAIFIVLLVGIGSFAADLGRLFVLRTQMQNAVDAAALAAAMELDGQAGAQDRAMARARELLTFESSYTNDERTLLSLDHLPDSAFTFYCSIGSKNEPDPASCSGTVEDSKIHVIDDDDDSGAHYVAIDLELREIDLYMLPALSAMGIETPATAGVSAYALAGRHFYICEFPPLMICDPAGSTPWGDSSHPIQPGRQVILKKQVGNQWAPGNFGFLVPSTVAGYSGNQALGAALADASSQGCSYPFVSTNPGNKAQWPRLGINTRFGLYKGGTFSEFTPSPNVVDYPRDDNLNDDEDKIFGLGVWNDSGESEAADPPDPGLRPSELSRNDYYDGYHALYGLGLTPPPGLDLAVHNNSTTSRWGFYQWELGSDGSDDWQEQPVTIPYHRPVLHSSLESTLHDDEKACAGANWFNKDCKVIDGATGADTTRPDRRIMTVAVVKCEELGIHGAEVGVPVSRFSHFFLTEHILPPGGGNEDKVNIYAEYIDDASGLDTNYHVEVQLYE
ncbi:MAG: Tad domain-containing protein [Candidatus Sedimenticola sp. (ex Thyasira tokunagai)]